MSVARATAATVAETRAPVVHSSTAACSWPMWRRTVRGAAATEATVATKAREEGAWGVAVRVGVATRARVGGATATAVMATAVKRARVVVARAMVVAMAMAALAVRT